MDYPEPLRILFERYSCRSFYPDPIPEEDLRWILEAARWAPSAGNLQPWHFYVVRQKALKKLLAQAAWNQNFIVQAAVVIVVCAIPEQSGWHYGERGRNLYVYQDTAAAVQNILLAATGLGYGSCWVGAFDEEAVRQILQLPAQQRPVAIIPIGKGPAVHHRTDRYPINQVVTFLDEPD